MTHNLFYPLGWFYHFLSRTFFSASEIARWPQTLRREINFTNETRKKCFFFLKGPYPSSFTFHSVNLDTKKHSPFLFSRWVWEWLALFARRLSTQSRVQSKFIPGNKFRASYWWGKLSRDDARDDKYRVSRIIELIAIMKYYCHVWRYWSHHDSQ